MLYAHAPEIARESSCKQIYSSPPSPPPTALRLLLLETSGCHEDSYRRVSSKLEVGQEIKKNHPRRKEVLVFINPPP